MPRFFLFVLIITKMSVVLGSRKNLGELKACPKIYAPVSCGGKTYGNRCEAEAAGCDKFEMSPIFRIGSRKTEFSDFMKEHGIVPPAEQPTMCPMYYAPVTCGGKRYSNRCFAKAAGCDNPQPHFGSRKGERGETAEKLLRAAGETVGEFCKWTKNPERKKTCEKVRDGLELAQEYAGPLIDGLEDFSKNIGAYKEAAFSWLYWWTGNHPLDNLTEDERMDACVGKYYKNRDTVNSQIRKRCSPYWDKYEAIQSSIDTLKDLEDDGIINDSLVPDDVSEATSVSLDDLVDLDDDLPIREIRRRR